MPSPGQPNCGTTGLRCVKTTFSVLFIFISAVAFAQQTTQLAATSCGSTVDLTTDLTADPVNGASKYEFRIENASLGYAQTIEKSNNRFKMFELIPAATDQQTYEVSVRIKQGNAYGTYGQKCNIQLNDHPKTKLTAPDCGRNHVLGATVLTADPVQGATQYEFNVENTALGFSETIIKSTNDFSLDELSGTIAAGASYQVSVKTEKGGQWNAWGQECVVEAMGLQTSQLLPTYCGATEVGPDDLLKFNTVPFATSYLVVINIYPMNPGDPVVSTDFTSTTTSFKLSDLQVGFFQGATYDISVVPLAGNVRGGEGTACTVQTPVDIQEVLGPVELTPDGIFDQVFDRIGNQYSLQDIIVPGPVSNGNSQTAPPPPSVTCPQGSGYFELYFRVGSGFEQGSITHFTRRAALCEVFKNISTFIPSPLSTNGLNNKVQIDIKPSTNTGGFAAFASSYYQVPDLGPAVGGIIEGEVRRKILTGTSRVMNNPNFTIAGNKYFDGEITFNFGPFINWHSDVTTAPPAGKYDMYSIALHEVLHALGFISLIGEDGLSSFGPDYPYYSMYDKYLSYNTLPLLTQTGSCTNSNYDFSFNSLINLDVIHCANPTGIPSDITDCNNAVKYSNGITPSVHVFTPDCYERGSSLSHFEDLCYPGYDPSRNNTYFAMSNSATNQVPYNNKRFLKPEEKQVLCDLGYQVKQEYGLGSTALDAYIKFSSGPCNGISFFGMDDGFSNGLYSYVMPAGGAGSVTIPDVFSNDIGNNGTITLNPACVEVLVGTGVVSATPTGQVIYSNSNTVGVNMLRYNPIKGGVIGNITYIFVYVGPSAGSTCATPLPCGNLVLNGDFEQFSALPDQISQIDKACGWYSGNGSPDYLNRYGLVPSVTVPCSAFGYEDDNRNGDAFAAALSFNDASVSELIYTFLKQPIEPDKEYEFAMDISRAEGTSAGKYDFQFYLSPDLSFVTPFGTPPLINNSNMLFSLGHVEETDGWDHRTYRFNTYGMLGGEQYLVIGTMVENTGLATTSVPLIPGCNYFTHTDVENIYYYFDNISLIELNPTEIDPIPDPICHNSNPFLLSASPAGGIFEGPGVIANVFDPAVAGPGGPYTIEYTTYNALGCKTGYDAQEVSVSNSGNSVRIEIVNDLIGLPTEICFANQGEKIELRSKINGPGNQNLYIVQWTGPNGTTFTGKSIWVNEPGIYRATTTNLSGCELVDFIEVKPCCYDESIPFIYVPAGLYAPGGNDIRNLPLWGIANRIVFGGNVVLQDYNGADKLDLNNMEITVKSSDVNNLASITLENTGLTIIGGSVQSGCDLMWKGFVPRSGSILKLSSTEIKDAQRAVYLDAHTDPDIRFRVSDVRFTNNTHGIYCYGEYEEFFIDPEVMYIDQCRFSSDPGRMKAPTPPGYYGEDGIYVNMYLSTMGSRMDVLNCGFSQLKNGIVFDEHVNATYTVPGIPLYVFRTKFTDIYHCGFYDKVAPTYYKGFVGVTFMDCDFNFATTVPATTQFQNTANSMYGIRSNTSEHTLIDNEFLGTYPAPTNIYGADMAGSGCRNLELSGNLFSGLNEALKLMVFGATYMEGPNTRQAGSIVAIEDNRFVANGAAIIFADNSGWTSYIPGTNVTIDRDLMSLNVHCNEFVNSTAPPNSYGIYVQQGQQAYLNNIGSCSGLRTPGGNEWPVDPTNSPDYPGLPINTWNSPVGWISIFDGNGGIFEYRYHANEFIGNVSSNSIVNLSQCGGTAEWNDGTNSQTATCVNDVNGTIWFPSIVANPGNDAGEVELMGSPNPVNRVLKVDYKITEHFDKGTIEVLGILGNKILTTNEFSEHDGVVVFDMSNLPNGSYILRIIVDGKVKKQRHIGLVK